jgi:hypothetical protein
MSIYSLHGQGNHLQRRDYSTGAHPPVDLGRDNRTLQDATRRYNMYLKCLQILMAAALGLADWKAITRCVNIATAISVTLELL